MCRALRFKELDFVIMSKTFIKMTRKDQNKLLDNKIESNINQYKEDRLNAEISAFSSGDLNKYEFLTRKDLKYKPNALDKAKFEFSPLGKAFSVGLDKTSQGYQEEGVIKLLKDIRDGLAGGVNRRPDDDRPNNRPDDDDRPNNRPDDDDRPNNRPDDDDRPNNRPDDDDRPNNRPDNDDKPNNRPDDDDRPNNRPDNDDRPNNRPDDDDRPNEQYYEKKENIVKKNINYLLNKMDNINKNIKIQ